MTRLRLDLSYDGREFAGWATQPQQRTVQETLETALGTVLRIAPPRLVVAGRTDAGVHAAAQVAHVDIDDQAWRHASAHLVRKLSGLLPPDLRVAAVTEVSRDFDARFSALWRRYRYLISDADFGADPLLRHNTVGWRHSLDSEAMREAAARLLGLHNFAAFCRRRDGASTIRELRTLDVSRVGDVISIEVVADAFCHSMVRSLVGALAAVGDGRQDQKWLSALLTRPIRADDITVAPAHGLTLIEVGYPPSDQLAARAAETRVVRTGATVLTAAPAVPQSAETLIDLSVLISTGMPICPGDPEVQVRADLTIAADLVNVARLHMGSQTGTHIDSPNHTLTDGLVLAALPLDRFIGRAVVADLRQLQPQQPITAEHLLPVRDRLKPGVVLLLCTGWSEHWGTDRYLSHPWLSVDAAEMVLERGVRTIGIDALSIDASPVTEAAGLATHYAIARTGGVIIENLRALQQLLDGRAYEAMVLPLKLDAADGAPVRAVARVL